MDGTIIAHSAVLGGAPLTTTTRSGHAARDSIYRYIQAYGAFGGFPPYAADALNVVAVAARRGNRITATHGRGTQGRQGPTGAAGAAANDHDGRGKYKGF